jgi:Xaa-Pro aminopeptidase
LIQKSFCDITEKGFRRILSFVKPMYTNRLKPGFEFYAIVPRVLHHVIGSGNNANVLHYIENNQQCKEVIWSNVGAEYANYSSDMTRTIPVSGISWYKAVYNAVLNVKKLQKCLSWWKQYHIEVGKLMTSDFGLGLIDDNDVQNENPDWPAYKNISCGTSHHGTDTRLSWLNLCKLICIHTVEPGIYIPAEGFNSSWRWRCYSKNRALQLDAQQSK